MEGTSVYDVAQAHRRRARARSAGRRRRGRSRCPIPACRRRWATPHDAGIPFELGIIRNHYVGRTFIEPTDQIRHLGVQAEAQRQPRPARGQARHAGRRFHRARHHLEEDRRDGARRRRHRSAYAHLQPADHAFLLLRHRHAGARRSCWPPIRRRGDGATSSASTAWPSSRSTASIAPWARPGATPSGRNICDACFTGDYPTALTDQDGGTARGTALAARRAAPEPDARSLRLSHGRARRPHRARHRRLARHRRAPSPSASRREGAHAHPGRAHRRRRSKSSTTRSARPAAPPPGAARPRAISTPSTGSAPRSMSASAGSTSWSAMPACSATLTPVDPYRAQGWQRGHRRQPDRQLAADPQPRSAAAPVAAPAARSSSPQASRATRAPIWGAYAVTQGGAGNAGRHLRRRDPADQDARQSDRSRPHPHPHARQRLSRRRPHDAARARSPSPTPSCASPAPISPAMANW